MLKERQKGFKSSDWHIQKFHFDRTKENKERKERKHHTTIVVCLAKLLSNFVNRSFYKSAKKKNTLVYSQAKNNYNVIEN